MKLKRFNEFYDIGATQIWGAGKVGADVLNKTKPSVAKKFGVNWDTERSHLNASARQAVHQKIEKTASPKDLVKHTVKPLSDSKTHKDYTVHHVKGKDGNYDTALLHHAKKGFVGLLNGTKKKDGFHVSESFISPAHRGKGLGVALYEHATTHHKGIVSDGALSQHSQRIYGHFAKQGRVTTYHDISYGRKKGYASDHGEEVTATEKVKTKSTGRLGKTAKVVKTLHFSSQTHENLGKTGGSVRLRIEPQKTSKKE